MGVGVSAVIGGGPLTIAVLQQATPLCPQPWTSVALTYLREMNIIAARRSEAASSSKGPAATAPEDPLPTPKPKAEISKEAQRERRSVKKDESGTSDKFCGAGKGPSAFGSSCSSTTPGLSGSSLGSFDSPDGNLGSGVSPCKVAFSQGGVDPLPTWSSL